MPTKAGAPLIKGVVDCAAVAAPRTGRMTFGPCEIPCRWALFGMLGGFSGAMGGGTAAARAAMAALHP